VCGIAHRSLHTAGRCKDCQRISAAQAAEVAFRAQVEQARQAVLTDAERAAEGRARIGERSATW